MSAPSNEVGYRRRLAEGFLHEARQDSELSRWRACVSNSQLATENAAKAMLATLGPVGRTHDPATLLRDALKGKRFDSTLRAIVDGLAECAELLGTDVHVESDYGDDAQWRTPWELLDKSNADQALSYAEKAVSLMSKGIEAQQSPIRPEATAGGPEIPGDEDDDPARPSEARDVGEA